MSFWRTSDGEVIYAARTGQDSSANGYDVRTSFVGASEGWTVKCLFYSVIGQGTTFESPDPLERAAVLPIIA